MLLAATDPANPYGAALPWPAPGESDAVDEARRPQRAVGALVVLYDGALVGWLGRSGESLLSFLPKDDGARAKSATGLADGRAELVESGGRRALLLATIDGAPAAKSALGGRALHAAAGFTLGREGWPGGRRGEV